MSIDVPIVLVNMPMSAVERPSLALGLLKSALTQAGLQATIAYPNIWFLEYIGIADYGPLESCPPEEALVDWLFAGVAFPDFEPEESAFLDLYFERNPIHAGNSLAERRANLLRLRSLIGGFIDWTADKILEQRPAMVGCSSTFTQHVPSLALLRRLSEFTGSCHSHGGRKLRVGNGAEHSHAFPMGRLCRVGRGRLTDRPAVLGHP
ncbi:hypothetical protein [Bradyrhizobium rifense]|uniref:hypothetical protein n=1 Tax=Bradyrhizobium rifense TaxID=515499 RepID=UPI001FE9E331|nr:hypothetical protein [Bradyrhizobium rifense]